MSDAASQSLAKLSFHQNGDSAMKKAASAGDAQAFQSAFIKSQSKVRKRIEKIFGDTPFVAAWSTGMFSADGCSELFRGMKTFGHNSELINQLAAIAAAPTPVSPLFVLVACEAMLRYPDGFSSEQLVMIFCRLSGISASDFCLVLPPDAEEGDGAETLPSVADIVTRAEVPFLMSQLLESQQSQRSWQIASETGPADCLQASTDTDGTLDAALARDAGQWLAPFVRVLGWAKASRQLWGNEQTTARWLKTLHHLAALVTSEGFVSCDAAADRCGQTVVPSDIDLFICAVRLTEKDVETGLTTYAAALANGGQRKPKSTKDDRKQPKRNLSAQSDWATTAVLRNTLQVDADVMSVDWGQSTQELRLSALGRQAFGGGWKHHIIADGKVCKSAGDWVCTCWFSDKEVAFAELESGSADGLRHVRHVMLSLKEHFAVLTDSVTAPDSGVQIDFESRLSLVDGFDVETNSISRDLILQGDSVSLRAVPVWLDDDRIQNTSGSCEWAGSELVMCACHTGGVTVPLVIDWHPDRRAAEADWSRLTVTEARVPVTAQQAAGYRVRIGLLQLLLYRSLRRGEDLRAVLGYHTANETVYSRVSNTGEILPLVLVESDA
ncbi:MAG: hypothetical protein P8J37_13755 [Fuerstiella sp.]|nr:hypothetical protein [Fuerstiella sp.]